MPLIYNPKNHHRRSIRLDGYDYTQVGAYFVTICTARRAGLLGEVVDGRMNLNLSGRIVRAEWERLPRHFPNIRLDAFVVMPNHIHGIIFIIDRDVGATRHLPVKANDSQENLPDQAPESEGGSPVRTPPNGSLSGSLR